MSGILGYQLEGHKRVGVPDLALNICPPDLGDTLADLQHTLGATFDPLHSFIYN